MNTDEGAEAIYSAERVGASQIEMSPDSQRQVPPADERPENGRLDSWKEIAAHLSRDVRTVQRWEKEEGLPVHRHAHRKLGTVFAYREELNAWSRRRQVGPEAPAPARESTRTRIVWAVAAVTALVVTVGTGFLLSLRDLKREPERLTFRQITTDTGLTWQPAISPKGDLVAYASDRATGGNSDIWVQQTAPGGAIRLTNDEANDSEPAFSPDGSMVAFRSERDRGGVYVVPALGGEAKRVADGGRRPRYSPDGKWIAYWIGDRPDRFGSLYIVPATGGEPKRLTGESLQMRAHVWAPDSQHLLMVAWIRDSALAMDWYVADLNGGSLIPTGAAAAFRSAGLNTLRRSPSLFDADYWSGDTSEIIFSGESADSTNLWKIAISVNTGKVSGPPVRLTSGTGLELHGSASTAGLIVFSSVSRNVDIWALPVDANDPNTAGEIVRVTRDAAADLSPSISADGKRLVFESMRTGKRLVWKKDLVTGEEKVLVATPSDEALPKISPDGAMVTFALANYENLGFRSKRRPDIYTVPFTGGQPQKVCAECGDPCGWSPDSATVLYQDGPAMGALVLASGRRLRILDEVGHEFYSGRVSPDGQWITFSAITDARQSFVAPFHGGQQQIPRAEWVPVLRRSGGGWSPDGRIIYTATDIDNSMCLWASRRDSKTMQPIGAPQPVYHFHDARLSLIENPDWRGVSVARDKIVVALNELRGNIWTATSATQAK